MITIREPIEKDLMHFTRYAIEYFRLVYNDRSDQSLNDLLRERKFWAADQLFANGEHQRLLIAEREGEVIGYILGTIENKEEGPRLGCVQEIFVDEFYRREGIGTAMCQQLMEWMQQRDVSGIRLNLLPGYPRAEEFFQQIGFIPMKTLYKWSPQG